MRPSRPHRARAPEAYTTVRRGAQREYGREWRASGGRSRRIHESSGLTRARPLAAALASLALLAGAAGPADAHLRRLGESLVALLAASDAVVFAEATGATQDERDPAGRLLAARTPFRALEPIAGTGPGQGSFVVAADAPPLRYARGQRAVVLLARDGDGWRAVQGTGAGLVAQAGSLRPDVRRDLAEVWRLAHAAGSPAGERAAALARLLDAEPPKLAWMAAADLADLAHEHALPASAVAAMRERLAEPRIDPALRAVLEHALAGATDARVSGR